MKNNTNNDKFKIYLNFKIQYLNTQRKSVKNNHTKRWISFIDIFFFFNTKTNIYILCNFPISTYFDNFYEIVYSHGVLLIREIRSKNCTRQNRNIRTARTIVRKFPSYSFLKRTKKKKMISLKMEFRLDILEIIFFDIV